MNWLVWWSGNIMNMIFVSQREQGGLTLCVCLEKEKGGIA